LKNNKLVSCFFFTQKAKKTLKWACELEEVRENSFKVSPQVFTTTTTTTASPMLAKFEVKRSMRRSFSHNEIVGLLKIESHKEISVNLNYSKDVESVVNVESICEEIFENKENINLSDDSILNELNIKTKSFELHLDKFIAKGKELKDLINLLNIIRNQEKNKTHQILIATNLMTSIEESFNIFKNETLDSFKK
jgi:hypothetical protein